MCLGDYFSTNYSRNKVIGAQFYSIFVEFFACKKAVVFLIADRESRSIRDCTRRHEAPVRTRVHDRDYTFQNLGNSYTYANRIR